MFHIIQRYHSVCNYKINFHNNFSVHNASLQYIYKYQCQLYTSYKIMRSLSITYSNTLYINSIKLQKHRMFLGYLPLHNR